MSRPKWSVPRRCPPPGGARMAKVSMSVGSNGANQPGASAKASITMTSSDGTSRRGFASAGSRYRSGRDAAVVRSSVAGASRLLSAMVILPP